MPHQPPPFLPALPPPPQLKVTEFGQLRSQLQAAARKQQGSLAVRDLSALVAPGQLVDTENLTTLVRGGGGAFVLLIALVLLLCMWRSQAEVGQLGERVSGS